MLDGGHSRASLDGLVFAPFELGIVFTSVASLSSVNGNVVALGDMNADYSQLPVASMAAYLGYEFFEADGVTPVDRIATPDKTSAVPIFASPERRSVGLLGIAVVSGLWWVRRKQ